MFDVVSVKSVGRGDTVMVDMFKNDAGVPELGDWYGILKIDNEPHLLVVDTTDPDNPRFAMRCKEELCGITLPSRAIQEDLDVWLGKQSDETAEKVEEPEDIPDLS